MTESWFQIDLAIPATLTVELQRDVVAAIQPRWHVKGIDIQQLEDGVFRLKLAISSEGDESPILSTSELTEFRDLVVSLVAFSAMVPVQLRSKGILDSPSEGKQRKQTSLGPMNYQFPPSPLSDLQPLVHGLALDPKYASAIHFVWEALNSEHPLYRFINLAVAVELLIRHDSIVHGSRNPNCGNPKCSYQLTECPKCARSWTIPAQLRERAEFLLPGNLASDFIKARNHVFHGLSDELHHEYSKGLRELNCTLLVTLRNYLGHQMGLPPINSDQLGSALDPPDITMTVSYTMP